MTWTQTYWDIVDDFYWEPSLVGLKSFPKESWGDDPDFIRIPRSSLVKGGSLYARSGKYKGSLERMRGLEVTLNRIFDIAISVMSDAVVGELLHRNARIDDDGPFVRLGTDIRERYGWSMENVTQQDGFFVSTRSLLGIEIKLTAPTSRNQVLKYALLMINEERLTGTRSQVGLLFVTPHESATSTWKQCGVTVDGMVADDFWSTVVEDELPRALKKEILDDRSRFHEMIARMRFSHISWNRFVAACDVLRQGLEETRPGDQTLARILTGLISAIVEHRGTGAVL